MIRFWRARALGPVGERHAARWLRARGFRILERNFVIAGDEVDLLALAPDGRVLVLVEVKTRQAGPTAPEERLDLRKQRALTRLASRLQQRDEHRDRMMRIDVVAVEVPSRGRPVIRHHVNAMEGAW